MQWWPQISEATIPHAHILLFFPPFACMFPHIGLALTSATFRQVSPVSGGLAKWECRVGNGVGWDGPMKKMMCKGKGHVLCIYLF